MTRKIPLLFLPLALIVLFSCSQKAGWQPVPGNIMTRWADDVNPENVWAEYPRPQLERDEWMNLNGLWDYTILPKEDEKPDCFSGKILVPFPVESALSGVKKSVGPGEKLWYSTVFSIPSNWLNQNIILHFEAVDWETKVWINGKEAGNHRGGYDPFSFDITSLINKGTNELLVSVWDPTDTGWQPLGKQVLEPGGIFYTPVTGIWQTVWIEPVPATYIESVKLIPDIENNELAVFPFVVNAQEGDMIYVRAFDNDELLCDYSGLMTERIGLAIPDAILWCPDNPHLYDLQIEIKRGEDVVDVVQSYFGMRKISLGKDDDGFTRIFLNNEEIFQNGPLDQGYWPDGIYTPPTEEAMRYDLEVMKDIGFNMLRKHVKIEPRRFYYLCDRLGLLVWQDMPNGDEKIGPYDPDIERSPESARQFEFELKQLIETKFNHPCIAMWVPFNEGWGQYETSRIVDYVKTLDPTRLVDNASGWTDRGIGDVHDLHSYPGPVCPAAEESRAAVLGEFGGLGLPTNGHMWQQENWGYRTFSSAEELTSKYEDIYTKTWHLKDSNGLCASVYTQITDVETETNGLMTYDREILKIDKEVLNRINTRDYLPAPQIKPFGGLMNKGDEVSIQTSGNGILRYTLDGSEPHASSSEYKQPIVIEENAILKARTFGEGEESRTVAAEFILTDLARPIYKYPYSNKYTAGGDFGLIDGKHGSDRFGDGKWQGFRGDDLDIVIDLENEKPLTKIVVSFLENTRSWIFLPESVEFLYSNDGKKYESLGVINTDRAEDHRETGIKEYALDAIKTPARYVKVIAGNAGLCPEWHDGKGEKCWIFVDEISIE